jgi:glycosyltransferase involved in cell wall biosynthesis
VVKHDAAAAVYISYFGLKEPLVQTQVLPYIRLVAASGVSFTLLTFEPASAGWTRASEKETADALQREGITWVRRRYHKRPTLPATLFDILAGAATVTRLVRRNRASVIHARSHVAAVMGAIARSLTGARLLFDIRGLLAEEYVSGGRWKEGGRLFRGAKAAERWLIRRADGFVVLTRRARDFFFPGAYESTDADGRPLEVIPTCTDVARFVAADSARDAVRAELGVAGRIVYVYVGSLGTWYLTDEMADFFAEAYRADTRAFVLCLTASDPRLLTDRLVARGLPSGSFVARRAEPRDVPRYLAAGDVGVSFSEAGVARLAASPTKLGEYLAAGLPVVQSGGVGDVDALVEQERVGAIIREYTAAEYRRVLGVIGELRRDAALKDRCRSVATREFDLRAVAGVRYRRIYEALMSRR